MYTIIQTIVILTCNLSETSVGGVTLSAYPKLHNILSVNAAVSLVLDGFIMTSIRKLKTKDETGHLR